MMETQKVGYFAGERNCMENVMRKLVGANMDIDLASRAEDIQWRQDGCPWNADENTKIKFGSHRTGVGEGSLTGSL
jgi:hypothetical protein